MSTTDIRMLQTSEAMAKEGFVLHCERVPELSEWLGKLEDMPTNADGWMVHFERIAQAAQGLLWFLVFV